MSLLSFSQGKRFQLTVFILFSKKTKINFCSFCKYFVHFVHDGWPTRNDKKLHTFDPHTKSNCRIKCTLV
ncbi:hypothetical protein HMPREF0083_01290 [Aneurinibacillus aneurinilyticus ATCC 12856]|uniref:Uncharacterized protein n=1 Tax=Aneurinibacillus aneurinilyticus ATCC 12856 TaxID=649747 RepID=U1YER6_ANEAE|nr:hypothetical protein HMPREF0083_01290 [Aneurinibacillus aneurinilyticus ATCC 12856]